jgi:hypothetical protein
LTVSISDATAGAKIYYTTDGSTPSAGSAVYSGPINVGISQTITALAAGPGYLDSGVAAATYSMILRWPYPEPR